MRGRARSAWFAVALLAAALSVPGQGAGEGAGADRTLSPYFLVKSEGSDVDRLPLKSTSVKVSVAGVIADVTVEQVYSNEGPRTLEAVYVFPGSTRAAVYAMKMTVGERVLEAKIRERQRARQEYEAAKKEGKTASLLEQQRPNVFRMSVANILPGDAVKVELRYTELLVPTGGEYEFAYPTVVGPRYSNRPESSVPESEKWVQNPYSHEGEPAASSLDIAVALRAGMPIQDVSCATHKTGVAWDGPSAARVDLDPSERRGGNRDFILKYRLAGGQIDSGLLLYEGEDENFFLMMVQPPRRVAPSDLPPGSTSSSWTSQAPCTVSPWRSPSRC